MHPLAFALLAAPILSACSGPASTMPRDPRCTVADCPPASAAFQGEWLGDATVTLPSGAAFSYPVAMFAHVDGYDVQVDGICPDGAGAFAAFATGITAAWSDDAEGVQCDDPTPWCESGLRFTSAALTASITVLRMDLEAECGGEPASTHLSSVRVEGVSRPLQ